MFSQTCVKNSVQGGGVSQHALGQTAPFPRETTPGRHPASQADTPGQTLPWADTALGRHTPPQADTPLPRQTHPSPGRHPSGQTPLWADTPLGRHPSGQTPLWADTPLGRHPSGQTVLWADSPSWQTPPLGRHTRPQGRHTPPQADTPHPRADTPSRWLLQWTVRILLECILVRHAIITLMTAHLCMKLQ